MSAEVKKHKDMPIPARLFAAAIGLAFLPLGVLALWGTRPLTLEMGLCAFITAGIGFDLFPGAIRGRWPVAILWWFM
jgi:hypothetical protein